MNLGSQGDLIILHDICRILAKIKNKYWKLGKSVATLPMPEEVKSQFYSLGNDMDKFLTLSKSLGVANDKANGERDFKPMGVSREDTS